MTKKNSKALRILLQQRKNEFINESAEPEVLKSPCFKGINLLSASQYDLTRKFVKKVIDDTPINEIKDSPTLGIAPSPLSGQLGYGTAMCPYEYLYGTTITIHVD